MTHFSAALRLVDLQVGELQRLGKVEQNHGQENHFFHGMGLFSLARVSESGSGPVQADMWAMRDDGPPTVACRRIAWFIIDEVAKRLSFTAGAAPEAWDDTAGVPPIVECFSRVWVNALNFTYLLETTRFFI